MQVFHEGRGVESLNVGEQADAFLVAPLGKPARGVQVGLPGVVVVDLSGEEFQRPPRCFGFGAKIGAGASSRAGERMISVLI